MKIYTKTGDTGETGLANGARIAKNSARISAIGTVDELNACVGAARCYISRDLDAVLEKIQHELIVVGSELATPSGPMQEKIPHITENQVIFLEKGIDVMSRECAPLTQFVLPGVTPVAAQIHICRVVCRRAERAVVTFIQSAPENFGREKILLRYLNRLSDFFFTAARWCNARANMQDVAWQKDD